MAGVTTNPNAPGATPPVNNTPPPEGTAGAPRPANETSAPPAERPGHSAPPPPATNLTDAASIAKGWQNIGVANSGALQDQIDGQVGSNSIETFQADNQQVRADASDAHVEGQRDDAHAADTGSRFRQANSSSDLSSRNFASMNFREGSQLLQRFQTQGFTQAPPNPNGAQGAEVHQGVHGEQAFMQPGTMPRRGEGEGQPQLGKQGQRPDVQPQMFRANGALGFLVPERGRQVAYIVTRQPIPGQNTDPAHAQEHAEGTQEGEQHEVNDHAAAGQLAGNRAPKAPGERRLAGADRTDDEGGEGTEGSGEEGTRAPQGDAALARVVANYHSGQGGGQGEQQREAGVRETVERSVVQFGTSEPDASTENRAEGMVFGVTVAGGGTYVRRTAFRQGQGGGGQHDAPFGSNEDRMVQSAQGVHAGRETDMGELRRLSVCVNGEMIDMGSTQGRARFDSICTTNPEVRAAAEDLVQQRQDYTRHVTANLFNINGGEPSARA